MDIGLELAASVCEEAKEHTIAQWLSVNFSCRDIVGTVITANLSTQEGAMPVSSLSSIFLLFQSSYY